jgi:hypothetical protein
VTSPTEPETWHRKPIKPIVVHTVVSRGLEASVEDMLQKFLAENPEAPTHRRSHP